MQLHGVALARVHFAHSPTQLLIILFDSMLRSCPRCFDRYRLGSFGALARVTNGRRHLAVLPRLSAAPAALAGLLLLHEPRQAPPWLQILAAAYSCAALFGALHPVQAESHPPLHRSAHQDTMVSKSWHSNGDTPDYNEGGAAGLAFLENQKIWILELFPVSSRCPIAACLVIMQPLVVDSQAFTTKPALNHSK